MEKRDMEKMRMSRQEGRGNEKEATTLGNPESDPTSAQTIV